MNIPNIQPCPNTLEKENYEKKWKLAGWIGACLVILGYYLNANMYAGSWVVWMFGNGLVGAYSYYKGAYSTMVMSFVILIMNIYGFLKWI